MKTITAAVLAGALCAACAQPGDSSPAAQAERQCGYFARDAGLNLVEVSGVDADGDNFRVRMRLEDALNRRVNATCVYSTKSNSTSWAQALPAYRRL